MISLPTNRGLGKALNEGLKHCSYDLVARMDTDDIAKPDRFEKQLAIFLEHPEIDVVGAWIDEFEGEVSNVLSMRKVPEQHENILRFAKGRCPVNHPVVMFRIMPFQGARHTANRAARTYSRYKHVHYVLYFCQTAGYVGGYGFTYLF